MSYHPPVRHTEGKALRFARNVGLNVLGQAGIAAAGFLLIPYLVHRLGTETYGLYILMYTVSGYLALLTFGAGSAAVKYVAEFLALKDSRGLGDAIRYSTRVHVAGSLAGAAILGFGARFLVVRLFHVPEALADQGVFVLRCAAAAALFVALIQNAICVLAGYQRFDWQNLLSFGQSALMPAGAAAILAAGLGLSGVALWYVALSAGLSFAAVLLVRGLRARTPDLAPGAGLAFKDFSVYSLSLWLGALAWIVTFQFDKVFLVRGVSLTGLTLYSVPSGLLQRLQAVPASIFTVLVPMVSELKGPDADESLRRMYLKSVRFLLWVMLPAYALLFALMPQFLGLWLGGEFGSASVWPARLLVASQFFYVLNYLPNAVAAGRDKPLYVSAVAWAQAVLSVLAWKLLVPRYQLLGVALGSLLAQAVPACAYLAHMHSGVLKIGWRQYAAEGLRAPLASAALLLAVVFPLHSGATSWARLFALGGAGALAFYASTWLMLSADDRSLVRRFARR